jgi:hypothetical protein
MKKSSLLLVSFLILILAASAFAQEKEANWRHFEFSVIGGLSLPNSALKNWNDSMGANTGYLGGISSGLYFNEKLCLGAYFTYSQYSMEKYDLKYKLHDVGLYLKYAFVGESNLEPYVKVSAGANMAKFATWIAPGNDRLRELSYGAGLSLGLYAGAMYYTSDNGGIFIEGSYHYSGLKDCMSEHKGIDYILGDNLSSFDIRGGVTVFFGPEK